MSGTLTLGGKIIANGNSGRGYSYKAGGGGSGGTIFLEAATLKGSGTVGANGGDGGSVSRGPGGGGGGGRIAVLTETNESSLTLRAVGGRGDPGGGGGTVFQKDGTQPGILRLEAATDGGHSKMDLTGTGTSLPALVSKGGWRLNLGGGSTFSADSLEVQEGRLAINVPPGVPQIPEVGSLTVAPNGILSHDHSADLKYGMRLAVAGPARIAGRIDVSGKGFPGGIDAQKGTGPGAGEGGGSDWGSGAGHGGHGGRSGGGEYGDPQAPSRLAGH